MRSAEFISDAVKKLYQAGVNVQSETSSSENLTAKFKDIRSKRGLFQPIVLITIEVRMVKTRTS